MFRGFDGDLGAGLNAGAAGAGGFAMPAFDFSCPPSDEVFGGAAPAAIGSGLGPRAARAQQAIQNAIAMSLPCVIC